MIGGVQAGCKRVLVMGLPLELRGPEAAGDQDGEFIQPRRERGMEARVSAEFLRQVAHLGTAQQHVERPVQRRARSGQDTVDQLLLFGRHTVVTERLEAAAAKVQVAGVVGAWAFTMPSIARIPAQKAGKRVRLVSA